MCLFGDTGTVDMETNVNNNASMFDSLSRATSGDTLSQYYTPPGSPESSEARAPSSGGGKYYANPYLNFYVRQFKYEQYRGKPASIVAKAAGAAWNQMSDSEKRPYHQIAEQVKRGNRRWGSRRKSSTISSKRKKR